jgi:hypothetical protein
VLRPSSLPHALAVVAAVVAAVVVSTVLAVLGAGLVGPTPSARGASAPTDPEQPLVPRIRSISPDYVPDTGPIIIRGTLTNVSRQTWTAINVHGFMGSTPLTTTAELNDAASTPLNADVGHRITVPGTFDSIASLAPGQSTTFKVKLPQSTLPVSSPGVYWFGVHVLGDNGTGGTRVAVGRDRTFLPYVPQSALANAEHEDAALVVPVRAGVARGPDGAVVDPGLWAQSLRSGPLHNAVAIGKAASERPLTWLVDPAVPDVVRRLAEGNPARTLTAPEQPGQGNESPSASPTASSSASSSGAAETVPTPATARAAKRWLQRFHALLGADTGEILGLPYGDLAVDSAAAYDVPLLRAGFKRTGHSLRPWGLPLSTVDAPPDGRTTGDTISRLPHDTTVLLPDTGVQDQTHVINRVNGHRVILASPSAAQGGPGPVDPQSSLALRQRILSEAALRVLDDQQPLVVELPTDTRRPLGPGFFSGLDVPWLRLTTLDGATAGTPTPLDATRLLEPPSDTPQFDPDLYLTAQDILENGSKLESVLAENGALAKELFDEVTGNASYSAEREPLLALYRMQGIDHWVGANLDAIDLAAPESVTLAGTSGRFSAIVSNELDVPVTVTVRAVSDPQLTITGGEVVPLAPHGRTTVLLNATTHQRGVHTVRLELTTPDGRPIGAADPFPMRAEQVSRLIWVIIGAGVALLFATIIVRLVRRVVRARSGGPSA